MRETLLYVGLSRQLDAIPIGRPVAKVVAQKYRILLRHYLRKPAILREIWTFFGAGVVM
jgi:hypothetical protein